jgi:acyl carrier protein
MADELLGEVCRALVRALDLDVEPPTLRPEMALHAPPIRMDSLGFYRLITNLERSFDIRLDETMMAEALVETIDDLVKLVRDSIGSHRLETTS